MSEEAGRTGHMALGKEHRPQDKGYRTHRPQGTGLRAQSSELMGRCETERLRDKDM